MAIGTALDKQTIMTANTFYDAKISKAFSYALCNIYYQTTNKNLLVLQISQRQLVCTL